MKDLSKYTEIIIWGTSFPPEELEGEATSHGHSAEKLYHLLEKNGYEKKLILFVDSNTALHGKKRFGRPVEPPTKILQHPKALIIINSLSMKAIQKAMIDMGIQNDCMIIPYYFYHGVLDHPYDSYTAQQHTNEHKNEILQLFDTTDEETKRYLDIIIQLREAGEDDLYESKFYNGTGGNLAYFCDPAFAPKGDVTFVDVGAFQGESIEPVRIFYGERLKSCIAFEPDSNSLQDIEKYIMQNNIDKKTVVFPYALGAEDKIIHFMETGSTSQQAETGGVEVEQKAFDSLQGLDIHGDVMVKMDIEGAELDALKGMENFIKTVQPYLAICLYHKEADLYDIPAYIKGLCQGYRLFIRGGWHLECWAVPELSLIHI